MMMIALTCICTMCTYCTGVLAGRPQRSLSSATTAMIVTATIRVNMRTPEHTMKSNMGTNVEHNYCKRRAKEAEKVSRPIHDYKDDIPNQNMQQKRSCYVHTVTHVPSSLSLHVLVMVHTVHGLMGSAHRHPHQLPLAGLEDDHPNFQFLLAAPGNDHTLTDEDPPLKPGLLAHEQLQ